jgi:hypothetical protein
MVKDPAFMVKDPAFMVKDPAFMVKDPAFMVKDTLHNYLDTTQIPFIKELILILCIYLFYYNSSFETFIFFIKYAFILFIIRYVLSTLTYKEKSDKKYFDLNTHVILLTLVLLLSNKYNDLPNKFLTLLTIGIYSLLVISTHESFTSDVIITIFIVYIFVNYKGISEYIVTEGSYGHNM